MAKVLILVLALALIVERITQKVLFLLPISEKKVWAWIVSTGLGLLISFSFSFGIIRELGLGTGYRVACWVDYFITGLLISSGSEPVHSIVEALAMKKNELKKKAKGV